MDLFGENSSAQLKDSRLRKAWCSTLDVLAECLGSSSNIISSDGLVLLSQAISLLLPRHKPTQYLHVSPNSKLQIAGNSAR